MKTILFWWVQFIVLSVIFAVDSQFDSCQAQPLNSWNLVLSNSPVQITSMAYGNGTFVGVGGGLRFISYNGSNWTTYANPPIINNGGVAFGNGMFLKFGTNSQFKANYVLQSSNGMTWTTIYTSSNALFAAAFGNNTWVFVGTNDIVTANVTSSNWSWSEFQPSFSPACITYGNGVFVIGAYIGGNYYSIFSSSDGITWQYDCNLGMVSVRNSLGIAYGNSVFVASSPNGVFVSSNLVNWTNSFSIGSAFYAPVAFGGNQFIVPYPAVFLYTSSDGYTWIANPYISGNWMTALTYGQGTFVATILGGSIYQSGAFASQSNCPATTLGISTYPGVTINGTAGAVYQIQYTTSLNSTWQTLTNFMLPYSPYLWVDTSSTVSGQRFYRSIQLK